MIFKNLASAMSWIGILVGIPNQIYRLQKAKTAREVSLLNWFIGFFSFAIWIPYAIQIQNYSLMWADVIGLSLSGIVMGQILYYRHAKDKKSP